MIQTAFNLAVVAARILLGFILFTAGMGKVTYGDYFPLTMFPVSLERLLAPRGLALLGHFISWSQVAIGLLLLSQRFATIGAIMCVPLISNIFIVTISFGFKGTPYLNAFLPGLNLFFADGTYTVIILTNYDLGFAQNFARDIFGLMANVSEVERK